MEFDGGGVQLCQLSIARSSVNGRMECYWPKATTLHIQVGHQNVVSWLLLFNLHENINNPPSFRI